MMFSLDSENVDDLVDGATLNLESHRDKYEFFFAISIA